MRKLFLFCVVVFFSITALGKSSVLFDKVLVNGAYEQVVYPNEDVFYVHPHEVYMPSYYISAPGIALGETRIEFLSVPAHLKYLPFLFNNERAPGIKFFWWDDYAPNKDEYLKTEVTPNGFKSSWFFISMSGGSDFWLGEINIPTYWMRLGDSIQYMITTVCYKTVGGTKYINHHKRTIRCVDNTKSGLTAIQPSTKREEMSIFPNPCFDKIGINVLNPELAQILDLQGRTLKGLRLEEGTNEIYLADLKPGIYILKIKEKSIKFIKR